MLASGSAGASTDAERVRPGTDLSSRQGDWIQTYTGLAMYPLDPRIDEICIEDIAHALSNLCRFTGHVSKFYSVAQHSVHVSLICKPSNALWGLLHDASEAYLADMSRPMKRSSAFGPIYCEAEDRLMQIICQQFGLSLECPEDVKIADTRLLMTEKRDLMRGCNKPWEDTGDPIAEIITPWINTTAEDMFLARFAYLTRRQIPVVGPVNVERSQPNASDQL